MIIFVHDSEDDYVEFYVWEAYYAKAEEMFSNKYGQRPRCFRTDAFTAMKEIDEWYMDNFEEGCVSFQFD